MRCLISGMKVQWSLVLALSPKFVARDHFPLVLCAFRSSSTEDDVLGTLQAAGHSLQNEGARLAPDCSMSHSSYT